MELMNFSKNMELVGGSNNLDDALMTLTETQKYLVNQLSVLATLGAEVLEYINGMFFTCYDCWTSF